MLTELRIRNLAIVENLELTFGPGLNLLTGETGAGKSIVIEALGLVLGDRADGDWLRAGAERAEIEALFMVGKEDARVLRILEETGLPAAPGELIFRRQLAEGGRSRQFVADRAVTLGTLRAIGDALVEIQGQHQHHALVDPAAQGRALDRFAGLEAIAARVASHASAVSAAMAEEARLAGRLEGPKSDLEYLRFQDKELEALRPREDEAGALREEKEFLQHATHRKELADRACRSLCDEDGAAVESLGRALSALEELATLDAARAEAARMTAQAVELVKEALAHARGAAEEAEPDAARIAAIEDRLAAYESLGRKHGVAPGALEERHRELRLAIDELESGRERLEEARRATAKARSEYLASAAELTAGRRRAAVRLAEKLADELRTLAMGACEVRIDVEPRTVPADGPVPAGGLDAVVWRIAPNPGEAAAPLSDIASGGELSRVMVAVNAVLGAKRARRTLVFDEVDAGIGGRTATAVGAKLRKVAGDHQVIVITHLAQIASLAQTHIALAKRVSGGRTTVEARALDRDGRVAEIARMMGGQEDTPVSLKHAAELLKRSPGQSPKPAKSAGRST